jgi:protein-S-isoprenylcysteine O-methyltransferase Ste14
LLLMIALAQVGWGKYLLPSPWLGGIPIAVGVLIAFVAIIRLHFIRHEEVLMAETIGDRYLPYQRQVRRWM